MCSDVRGTNIGEATFYNLSRVYDRTAEGTSEYFLIGQNSMLVIQK